VHEGRLLQLSAGGLYNGLFLAIDDETRTYWNHITGEAVHGPLRGARMQWWPVPILTVAEALRRYPDLTISLSQSRLLERLVTYVEYKLLLGRGFFPPGFHRTMARVDQRLPQLEHGLGVVDREAAVFFPLEHIRHGGAFSFADRLLSIRVEKGGVPFARWMDGTVPQQLFLRWYGFSSTFQGCDIYAPASQPVPTMVEPHSRRVHPRYDVTPLSPVEGWMEHGSRQEQLIDVSLGGCAFNSLSEEGLFAIGSRVRCVFRIRGAPELVYVEGQVMHLFRHLLGGRVCHYYGVRVAADEQRKMQAVVEAVRGHL
jgi:hypothetical protein